MTLPSHSRPSNGLVHFRTDDHGTGCNARVTEAVGSVEVAVSNGVSFLGVNLSAEDAREMASALNLAADAVEITTDAGYVRAAVTSPVAFTTVQFDNFPDDVHLAGVTAAGVHATFTVCAQDLVNGSIGGFELGTAPDFFAMSRRACPGCVFVADKEFVGIPVLEGTHQSLFERPSIAHISSLGDVNGAGR